MIDQRLTSGYARVNRHRPCRICGKRSWCTYTRDEEVSICMRKRDGARRVNQHGGAIFVHTSSTVTRPTYRQPPPEIPQIPLAPLAVRDAVYRTLLRLSPATRYRRLLIDGPKGLVARGFSEQQLETYGALPARKDERAQLAAKILATLKQEQSGHISLSGVPGFWRDETGWRLWTSHNYRHPFLLIPSRDRFGRIQACQLRSTSRSKKALRYCWLSSSSLPNGVGSGSPLHFTFRADEPPSDAPILIVEGLLKADALVARQAHHYAIAVSGVTVNHEQVIEVTKGRKVVLAFDQDYMTNPTVCLNLAALIARRAESESTLETTLIACWPTEAKGIDDAAIRGLPISAIGVALWLARLHQDLRGRVRQSWQSQERLLREFEKGKDVVSLSSI